MNSFQERAVVLAPGPLPAGGNGANTLTMRDGATIHYKDWGKGQPVVFSHGWPLSADAFEDQMVFLADRGYRRPFVIPERI